MHFVYIIYSKSVDKFYTGESSNPKKRVEMHNNENIFKNGFTKMANDWKLILEFECRDRKEALYLESFIKRMKSRQFTEKIIRNPEILSDILAKRS